MTHVAAAFVQRTVDIGTLHFFPDAGMAIDAKVGKVLLEHEFLRETMAQVAVLA